MGLLPKMQQAGGERRQATVAYDRLGTAALEKDADNGAHPTSGGGVSMKRRRLREGRDVDRHAFTAVHDNFLIPKEARHIPLLEPCRRESGCIRRSDDDGRKRQLASRADDGGDEIKRRGCGQGAEGSGWSNVRWPKEMRNSRRNDVRRGIAHLWPRKGPVTTSTRISSRGSTRKGQRKGGADAGISGERPMTKAEGGTRKKRERKGHWNGWEKGLCQWAGPTGGGEGRSRRVSETEGMGDRGGEEASGRWAWRWP